MSLSPGTATNGYTGALALKSSDIGGINRYLPCYVIEPTPYDGKEPVMLINNTAFAVNVVQGTCFAIITLRMPLLAGLHDADFFARSIMSGLGDTGTSGYHDMTVWSDNLGGDAPRVYGRCKFSGMRLTSAFSRRGGEAVAFLDFQLISLDPESTVIAPAATPAAGPLANAGILGWGQLALTGVSDANMLQMEIATGLDFVPGNVPGNNPVYPVLARGLMQSTVAGTVTVRTLRNPATVLKSGNLTAAFGKAGAGIQFITELERMTNPKPMRGGINFNSSQYFLNSNDGSSPLTVADL